MMFIFCVGIVAQGSPCRFLHGGKMKIKLTLGITAQWSWEVHLPKFGYDLDVGSDLSVSAAAYYFMCVGHIKSS